MPVKPLILATSASDRLNRGSVVEYEQHGKPILCVVQSEANGKFRILNLRGQELELESGRLYHYPGSLTVSEDTNKARTAALVALDDRAARDSASIDLEQLWELFADKPREISVFELTELHSGAVTLESHLAMRRALLADEVYFKRKKFTYEPRSAEVVATLKEKLTETRRKQEAREILIEAIFHRIQGKDEPIPEAIEFVVQYAAHGNDATEAAEAHEFVEEVVTRLRLELEGKREELAFSLLVKIGRFTPDENLDLIRKQRTQEFSPKIIAEIETLKDKISQLISDTARADLTSLHTFTIDGSDTLDIDDALSVEQLEDGLRIGVHITDVASAIEPGSLLWQEAYTRATSIYTPDQSIPMLPRSLSENALSLVAGETRLTISSFATVMDSGEIVDWEIKPSIIRVKDRFTYEQVDNLLYSEKGESHPLSEGLLALWRASSTLESIRLGRGAIQFSRRELWVKISPGGKLELIESNEDTPSRKLVGELMILANSLAASYATSKRFPLLFRSQETPDAELGSIGNDIPPGVAREYAQRSTMKRSLVSVEPLAHFGLGLPAYLQITSPIRRFLDLVNQRQLLSVISKGHSCYSAAELLEFQSQVEIPLDDVTEIQRNRTRYWLLRYIEQRKFKELKATVLKVGGPKPMVELTDLGLFNFYSPKRGSTPKPGDEVTLRIDRINPRRGELMLVEG